MSRSFHRSTRFPATARALALAALLTLPALATGSTADTRQSAFEMLKAGNSPLVQQLPRGERELMMAKMLLDQGDTKGAIALLGDDRTAGNKLAAAIRAEAYRRQSVQAAIRAGNYAHSVSADIDKLKNARLSTSLDEAEQHLQAFIQASNEKPKPAPVAAPVETIPEPAVQLAAAPKAKPVAETAPQPAPNTGVEAPIDQIAATLEAWRTDWESRDHAAYISHYHPDFSNRKYHSLAAWSAYKQRVNGRKAFIRIAISNLKLQRGPEANRLGEGVLVSFRQRYESNNFSANGNKYLYLVRESAGKPWRILFEGESAIGLKVNPPKPAVAPKADTPPAAKTDTAVLSPNKSWVVNIGAFESWPGAEQMASDIRADTNYSPSVATIFGDDGSQLYRVRLGPYESRSKAIEMMINGCQDLGLLDCWLEQLH